MEVKPKPPVWFIATGFLLAGLLAGLLLANFLDSSDTEQPKRATSDTSKTIVIAGDIACEPGSIKTNSSCLQEETAALTASLKPDAVLTAGDNQYPKGTLRSYMESYDKFWGAFKDITHPTPGNHEYLTPDAAGYFDYFGERAGERGKGYYFYKVGDWLMIALNSEIDVSVESEQIKWLEQVLEMYKSPCTLAYWHKPRFSTGGHDSDPTYDALWRVLYANDVDIVVNGHSHGYERFIPQTPDAASDPERGVTQFVSGLGGLGPQPMGGPLPTLAARQNHAFGVLKLKLYPKAAHYEFVPVIGSNQTYSDSGTIACH